MTKIHTVPFHIGDLITDTMHLSAAEFGAYMRLILTHYRMGIDGIPNDDKQLRRITGLDNKTWNVSRDSILSFFTLVGDRRWVHGRVQTTLLEITAVSEQNARKALLSHDSRRARAMQQHSSGNATAVPSKSQKPEAINSDTNVSSLPPTPIKQKVGLDDLSVDHIRDWLAAKRMDGKYLHHDEHFILERFKDYCLSKGKKYADYVAGYRNAFEWESCQPKHSKPAKQSTVDIIAEATRQARADRERQRTEQIG